jgi:hypothetical protein
MNDKYDIQMAPVAPSLYSPKQWSMICDNWKIVVGMSHRWSPRKGLTLATRSVPLVRLDVERLSQKPPFLRRTEADR